MLLRTEASDQRQGMIVMTDRFVLINPDGLHPTSGYAHLTIAEAGTLCPSQRAIRFPNRCNPQSSPSAESERHVAQGVLSW